MGRPLDCRALGPRGGRAAPDGGGFVAWWHARGLGREELGHIDSAVAATEFACLVAARTCARPGASPPRLSELEAGVLG